MRKTAILLLLCMCLCLPVLSPMTVSAVTTQCDTYNGSNVEAQNYTRWSSPVTSYLVPVSGGVMRVQSGSGIDGLLVEYYDNSHNIDAKKTKHIQKELPIFGGFYAASDAYYVLTGQNNKTERADVEVFRITKYDTNWKRIGSAGLYDCNTTVPFEAGSARMTMYGNYLLVRTSHEMYKSSDGLNHQANVTIELDTKSMKITDSYTSVMNSGYGYVSHSFNQFIAVENGHIVAVDHGDAYPRSIALIKYKTDVSTGKFVPEWGTCEVTDVMKLAGAIGQNSTGASVGAFEVSDTSYLVAGNSVVQDEKNTTRQTRNVFVAYVPKSGGEPSITWLTSYKEGDGTTSTPQMVKIASDRYLVLWSRDGSVYYTEVNGSGKKTGNTYSMKGSLSDCVPVVSGGNVTWYVWNYETITFYDIKTSNIASNSSTVIKNGHRYEHQSTASNGKATLKCSVCGKTETVGAYTSFDLMWNTNGGNRYSSSHESSFKAGDVLYVWFKGVNYPKDVTLNNEWVVEISDTKCMTFTGTSDEFGYFTMKAPGSVTVTVHPKYNPGLSKSVKLVISCKSHDKNGKDITTTGAKAATCTSNGYTGDKVCSICGEVIEKGKSIDKIPHDYQNGKCTVCGAVMSSSGSAETEPSVSEPNETGVTSPEDTVIGSGSDTMTDIPEESGSESTPGSTPDGSDQTTSANPESDGSELTSKPQDEGTLTDTDTTASSPDTDLPTMPQDKSDPSAITWTIVAAVAVIGVAIAIVVVVLCVKKRGGGETVTETEKAENADGESGESK